MRALHTAIIQLREPTATAMRDLIQPPLETLPGVRAVAFEPKDSLITVGFDGDQTALAEIVRAIEDAGLAVSSVAERPLSGTGTP